MSRLEGIILSGLARVRSVAGSFPPQFNGLRYEAVGDGTCTVRLPHAPQVLDSRGRFSVAAISILCDLCLSGAVRSRAGRAATTPTVTLQIEYDTWPVASSDILCKSVFHGWLGGDLATATATIETSNGINIGSAYGRFFPQERTADSGFSRFPWEIAEDPLTLEDLTAEERQVLAFLMTRAASSPRALTGQLADYNQLNGIVIESSQPDAALLRQPTGPHLANRSGFVFGGVMGGLLADACLHVQPTVPGAPARLLSSSCTFLRPGRTDRGDLLARAQRVFEGRRLSCMKGAVTNANGECLAVGEVFSSKTDPAT